MTDVCTHLDTIQVTSLPENVPGCEDCLRIGGWWVHLRLCLTARSLQHPIIRSLERGEDWCWCYEDEIAFQVDLAEARS
jgi:hypothetical protein